MTQLNTDPSDGGLSIDVGGFGSFGSLISRNANYDPIGDSPESSTTYLSKIAIRVGGETSRTFIGDIPGIADPIITYDPNNQPFLVPLTTTISTFNAKGLNFELTQKVSDLSQDQNRTGSNLEQTYKITNPNGAPISLELVRYFDGDLKFDGSIQDTGGRLTKTGREIFFEKDSGDNVDAQSSTTFIGITAEGGSTNYPGRYEVGKYSSSHYDDVYGHITDGIDLNDQIEGDTNGNGFIDTDAYDVTSALSNKYVINPGETVTYTTNTIFGQGAPAAVVLPNRPPTISTPIADTVATQGSVFNFAVPSNSFQDPDGNTLTYKATLDNGNPLPTWLAFDPNTRLFSGTPSISDVTNINVNVTATDPQQASVTDTFKIEVVPSVIDPLPPSDTDYRYEFLSKDVVYKTGWVAGDILQAKYQDPKSKQIVGDYVVDKVFDDPQTGFYALGLTSKTLAPVLLIRGTELTLEKIFTDINADINSESVGFDQYQKNNDNISKWLAAASKLPDITGHSLGGALAQNFAADATSKGQRLGNIITFNSPGIAADKVDKFNPANTSRVKHYIVSGDVVSLSGAEFIPGGYEVFDTNTTWNLFDNHVKPVIEAPGTRSIYVSADVSSLNNKFFGYFDPEYLAVLTWAEAAILANSQLANPISQTIEKIPFEVIPPALLFRGTTEALRSTIGGDISTIGTLIASATTGNIPVAGGLSVPGEIKLVPNIWEIKDANLKFNTVEQTVSGSANILIPAGIAIGGSLGFARGQLDSIALNTDKLNIPIAATGASLQSIGGSVKNLTSPNLIEFGGKVNITDSLTGRIDISLPFPFNSLINDIPPHIWSLDVTGKMDKNSLTGTGELTILGGLAKGSATARLDWNQRLLSADTDLSILNGFISTRTGFITNPNSDIVLAGKASITVPTGIIGAGTSVNGKFKLQYINDNSSSNDFVASYGEIRTLFGNFDKSTKVSFDGKIDWSAGKELFDLPTPPAVATLRSISLDPSSIYQAPLAEVITATNQDSIIQPNAPLAAASAATINQYTVQPNAQWLILNAGWGTSNSSVQVQLKSPDGKIINESDFAANNIAIVNDLTDTQNRSVIISKPVAGTWLIEVVNPTGLDSLHYRAFRDSVAPTIELDPIVNTGNGNFTINYKAIDPDSTAKVSLFYSTDPSNFNGALIKNDLAESDGVSSYSWNAKELAEGDYYVYASIEDGDNAPIYSYAPGKVAVNNNVVTPVVVNTAPFVCQPLDNAVATQNKPFTLTIPALTFQDCDPGDVLTYSATLGNGSPLPSWLKFDSATGTFAGTPTSTSIGNLQVKVTATDKAQAQADSIFDLNVLAQPLTIQKATDDVWNISGSGKVKVSLLGKNTKQVNEVGVFKLDNNNRVNGIAPGDAGFAKAALENSSVMFSTLPDKTTDGLNPSQTLDVNDGDRLGFFVVSNGSVEEDLKNNEFNNVSTSIDPANPYVRDPLEVIEHQGAYTLNWQENNDLVLDVLSLDLQVDNTPTTPLSSISSLQGQKEGETIDLRDFIGQDIQATFTVKRDAKYNDTVSFYKIDDAAGTVTSLSGVKFRPQDSGYMQAVLSSAIAGLNLVTQNGQTNTIERTMQGGSLYAPILMSNVTSTNPTGEHIFTPFSLDNTDRTDHVRLLGNNTFGFEDMFNGGDKDFNDVVVQASFKTI
jgi:Putative Ig domain/Domain of unknown function (DUF4114)/Lipase (class 3)